MLARVTSMSFLAWNSTVNCMNSFELSVTQTCRSFQTGVSLILASPA
jgi:hypothetical protein